MCQNPIFVLIYYSVHDTSPSKLFSGYNCPIHVVQISLFTWGPAQNLPVYLPELTSYCFFPQLCLHGYSLFLYELDCLDSTYASPSPYHRTISFFLLRHQLKTLASILPIGTGLNGPTQGISIYLVQLQC